MEDINSLWQKVLAKLEVQVSTVSFELWIKPIEVLDLVDKNLYIVTSSITAKNQILKNHLQLIQDCVRFVFNPDTEVVVFDHEEKENYLKNKTTASIPQESFPEKILFNPKYTFENFVVGSSNQMVYAACRAVAENPGKNFNPLFIYGGVGLGKTHLLHAIGNYIIEQNPNLKIKYVTCNNFVNDYVQSLISKGERSKIDFREKYRSVDVLLVDDIQFLAEKESTQEEFFHTFNDLYQNNKQIILSSDRPPKEIKTLTERLESRFASGLIQDIQPPEYETRIAILKTKARQERYFIDDEVIEFIARKINSNIREMEGLLSKVHFFASLLGKKTASIEDAQNAFKETENSSTKNITMDTITNAVCTYFQISKEDIIGKRKSKNVVEPRMIAIYLIYDILGVPLKSIGDYFGGRDHTTIMYTRDKISEQLKTNLITKKQVSDIRNAIDLG